jgi:hypothetical protein
LQFAYQYLLIAAFKKIKNSSEIPGGSLDFFLELLELLLGSLAARSRLLRELFCLGLLRFVQLLQLFLTRWQTVTSLTFIFFIPINIPVSLYEPAVRKIENQTCPAAVLQFLTVGSVGLKISEPGPALPADPPAP